MRTTLVTLALAVLLAAPAAAARKPASKAPAMPAFDPKTFSDIVDNPYFPLRPGMVLVYETRSGDSTGVDTVTVTHDTKTILGVAAIAVLDRAWRRGTLVESTTDWYAQDRKGNVWYLGEESEELRDGKMVRAAGSWEAGRDSAQPGLIMPAVPQPGMEYRQEHRPGVAEDMARVLSLTATAKVLKDSYTACVETEEWSPLEPKVVERKVYAPGLGLVLERTIKGGDERLEMTLIKVIPPEAR